MVARSDCWAFGPLSCIFDRPGAGRKWRRHVDQVKAGEDCSENTIIVQQEEWKLMNILLQ